MPSDPTTNTNTEHAAGSSSGSVPAIDDYSCTGAGSSSGSLDNRHDIIQGSAATASRFYRFLDNLCLFPDLCMAQGMRSCRMQDRKNSHVTVKCSCRVWPRHCNVVCAWRRGQICAPPASRYIFSLIAHLSHCSCSTVPCPPEMLLSAYQPPVLPKDHLLDRSRRAQRHWLVTP